MKITNFLTSAGPVISKRGRQYWEEGRVAIVKSDDEHFVAKVSGSRTYNTSISLSGDDIVSHECDCPYEGNLCKHEVALLLEIRHKLRPAMRSEPPKNPNQIITVDGAGLSEMEFFLLCALECFGYDNLSELSYIPASVHKGWSFTATQRKSLLSSLVQKGFVVSEPGYWHELTYTPRDNRIFAVLKELVSSHPQWLYFFTERHGARRPALYLIQLAEFVTGKRSQLSVVWPYLDFEYNDNYHIDETLKSVLLSDDGLALARALTPSHLSRLLNILVDESLESCRPDRIPVIRELLSFLPDDTNKEGVLQHLQMFEYYALAAPLPEAAPATPSVFYYYPKAVEALYQDRLDDSVELFNKGLSLCKSKGKKFRRLIPLDNVSFFLYVIALGRRRKSSDLDTLKKILSYRNEPGLDWCKQTFALVDFFQSTSQPKDIPFLQRAISGTDEILSCSRAVASILLQFFGAPRFSNADIHDPRLAVLRCEAQVQAPPSWPYPSALAKFVIREPWELELEDILRSVAASISNQKATAELRESRLAYLAGNRNGHPEILEVLEQYRLKKGDWSKGKKVSLSRFSSGDIPMDDIDTQIIKEWTLKTKSSYYMDYPSLEFVLPYLKGTDKLLLSSSRDTKPVSVREDSPYIYTESKADNIVFRSNLPLGVLDFNSILLDCSNSAEWVFFRVSPLEHQILKRLLELKKVPQSATPMLGQLFETLKGKIEIHSDIAGVMNLEQIEGQSVMMLRAVPQGDSFLVSLHFTPLDGGTSTFFPGQGNERIFDSKEGQRFEVRRNLRREKRSLDELNLLFVGSLGAEVFRKDHPEIQLSLIQMLGLLELLPENKSLFGVEWPEGSSLRVREAKPSNWSLSAIPAGGWFELEGEISLTEEHLVTVAELLAMFRESSGRFIRLGDSEYLHLTRSLQRQLQRIDTLVQETRGGKLRTSGLALAVSGESLQGDIAISEPDSILKMRQRIRESERLEITIPDSLNASLRDYQEDGVRWMIRMADWGAGVCLADDMGLGKTLQTLAVMLSRVDYGPQMVVAPTSVVGNWQREAGRFAPTLNLVMLNDLPQSERGSAIASLSKGDLLVLSYGLLVSEIESLSIIEWACVCLDEAHTIKNRDTKSSAAAMRLSSSCRIILTGTPIQNHLGELWNLFQFINPGLLGSYEHFNEKFITPISAGRTEVRSQLKRLISPFLLRRTKQQVARELPDKEEIIVPVRLSDEEMSVYEVLRREACREIESSASVNVSVLAMITRLREAACAASLVAPGRPLAAEGSDSLDAPQVPLSAGRSDGSDAPQVPLAATSAPTSAIPSSKLSVMIEKLLQIVGQGNRVLIFSQFTSFLEMACRAIEAAGITDYFYLNGSTPLRVRQAMVDAFQNGAKRVFLISLKAGGLGLNLTGANYVIHLDPWWNPAIEQQATDRAYRIGQDQKVVVYHLISEHTIEEKILRLHNTKQTLADALLEGTDLSHKLSTKDLLEMIS